MAWDSTNLMKLPDKSLRKQKKEKAGRIVAHVNSCLVSHCSEARELLSHSQSQSQIRSATVTAGTVTDGQKFWFCSYHHATEGFD
jgi:hypothetical protein